MDSLSPGISEIKEAIHFGFTFMGMKFPHEIIDLDNDLSIQDCVEERRNLKSIRENSRAALLGLYGPRRNRGASLARWDKKTNLPDIPQWRDWREGSITHLTKHRCGQALRWARPECVSDEI